MATTSKEGSRLARVHKAERTTRQEEVDTLFADVRLPLHV